MSDKRVSITVRKLKDGWDGKVRVNGEFYAGATARRYYEVLQLCAHYAAGVTSEMEGRDDG